MLQSSEGVQQGDPLGPLLFCLTIDAPLKSISSEFVTGYLDDVGLGDTVPRLIEQVRSLEIVAASIGLSLNHSKCEIIGLQECQRSTWKASGLNFRICSPEDGTFLGSPLSVSATSISLRLCRQELESCKNILLLLPAHEAFFLLKGSLGVPR